VGNPVLWASHSTGSIDVTDKEGEAVGLNNLRFQNIYKNISGGKRL
jgi:hypothetical protein